MKNLNNIRKKNKSQVKNSIEDVLRNKLNDLLLEAIDYINTHKEDLIREINDRTPKLSKSWKTRTLYDFSDLPITFYSDVPSQEINNFVLMIHWFNNIFKSNKREELLQILLKKGIDKLSALLIPYIFFTNIAIKIIDYNEVDPILKIFDDEWDNFSQHLGKKEVEYNVMYPILSLVLEDSDWQLSSSIKIRQITMKEILKLIFLSDFSTCIEVKKELHYMLSINKEEKNRNLLFQYARDIINLLNLYFLSWVQISDTSYFETRSLIYRNYTPVFSKFKRFQNKFAFLESDLKITEEKKEAFQEIYAKFEDAYFQEKNLLLIMERLNTLFFRTYEPDIILDLVMLFEILMGVGTETSFRISVYTTAFIGQDSEGKKNIYQSMRNFYKVRNDIIHGRDYQKNFKKFGGIELMKKIFEIFREVLIKFISSYSILLKEKISFKEYIELNLFD